MKQVVILGAGRVGAAIAIDLAKDTGFNITVADVAEPALVGVRAKGRIATQSRYLSKEVEVRAAI